MTIQAQEICFTITFVCRDAILTAPNEASAGALRANLASLLLSSGAAGEALKLLNEAFMPTSLPEELAGMVRPEDKLLLPAYLDPSCLLANVKLHAHHRCLHLCATSVAAIAALCQ